MNEQTPNPNARINELISLALDDRLSPEEVEELEQLLRSDPDAEAVLRAQMQLHADLAWRESPVRPFSREELETVAAVEEAIGEASEAARHPRSTLQKSSESWILQFTRLPLLWQVAAVVAVAAIPVLWMVNQRQEGAGVEHSAKLASQPPGVESPGVESPSVESPIADPPPAIPAAVVPLVVAQVVRTIGADFTAGEQSSELLDLQPGQVVEFGSGIMQLQFGGGAKVVLTAPAQFRVDSENQGTLYVGQLAATIPEGADSFVVMTPDAEVVDLGTRFTVSVNKTGKSSVHVHEGRVDVSPRNDRSDKHRVVAGQAIHMNDANKVTPLLPDEVKTSGAIRSLDAPDHRIVALQDAFVVGGSHADKNFGEQLDLRVKRDVTFPRYNRKAWIDFDLSSISREQIRAARLTLSILPNTLAQERTPNYKPIGHTWQFLLSGLWDEFYEPWNEGAITWNNAPGNAANEISGRLAGSRAPSPLGSFHIERSGDYGQQVVVESPQLTEFLKSDSDGHVTLIISRETGYTWRGVEDQVVHGFASREYKKLPPPTLEIWGGTN